MVWYNCQNWSPVSEIIWTHGKKILQCIDSRDSVYASIDDIAVQMRALALNGYGLSVSQILIKNEFKSISDSKERQIVANLSAGVSTL